MTKARSRLGHEVDVVHKSLAWKPLDPERVEGRKHCLWCWSQRSAQIRCRSFPAASGLSRLPAVFPGCQPLRSPYGPRTHTFRCGSPRQCGNAASVLANLVTDRFVLPPWVVCIRRFPSLGLRKRPKVSLVLRCNVAARCSGQLRLVKRGLMSFTSQAPRSRRVEGFLTLRVVRVVAGMDPSPIRHVFFSYFFYLSNVNYFGRWTTITLAG